MLVRALDQSGDWTFGAGTNDYKSGNLAVVQNIKTVLSSWIGNCFFDMGRGVNWSFFLGSKGPVAITQLSLQLAANLLNLQDSQGTNLILGINQLSFNLGTDRNFSISYQVQSIYSVTGADFQYDLGSVGGGF